MRENKSTLLFLLLISTIGVTFYFSFHSNNEKFEAENEERPDMPILSGEEKELYLDYLEKRKNQPNLKSAQVGSLSSYANGNIQGEWAPKLSQSGWFGYRVDNSAYDSLRNVFYVVSYAGHLYKLEYQNEIKWTLLNHKIQLNPLDNSQANPIFMGTLLPDSTFRLIRSYEDATQMEYSDDEGITWNKSTGAFVNRSWSNQAFEITGNNTKKIVLHTYYSNYHHIYFSDDNGASYTESQYSFPTSDYDIQVVKPFYTNEAYLWVWSKSTKKLMVYKYNPVAGDFELDKSSDSVINGSNLSRSAATYYNGKYHFYLCTSGSGYSVYYSSDEGATWVLKNSERERPFEVICPDKPNILISGFEDMQMSTDYGSNWGGYSHKLGWDLQHLKTFEKADGGHITLAGLDFGCYISETPDDKNSYTWCNNGAWYAMHYDAASSRNYNSIYMANQDRGTTAYLDTGSEVNTVDVDGTDVLRIGFANREKSVWSWFYYGRIKHRYNFPTGISGESSYDGLGSWWAAPIIAYPDPSEDAIIAAYGSNLQKFSFDALSNSITKTIHPFNFQSEYGQEIGGFSYSELNRNLWYVALNNGAFIYSEDAGETWTKSGYLGITPKANDQAYNYTKNQIIIKASKIDTNRIYYAGVGNILLISEDGGKSFRGKNRGLNIYRIRDFALSPDEKYIFAACGFGGAWVYSVDENYWYQMSDDPIPSVDFTDVEFIENKNCVRFATFGSGILDFNLSTKFSPVDAPTDLSVKISSDNKIELTWTDNSTNEDGFYIEKDNGNNFVRIDTLSNNVTTYKDSIVNYGETSYYRVKSFKNDTASISSNMVEITTPLQGYLSQSSWSVLSVNSEDVAGGHPASHAIDANSSTFWLTEDASHPYNLILDLGYEANIAGLRYLPRQDGIRTGTIKGYELYITNDLANWGTSVLSGSFSSTTSLKEAMMNQPVSGRYVKFVALSEINGTNFASAAEISLLYETVIPDTPFSLNSFILNETSILLLWKDNSINAEGYIIEQLIDGEYVSIDSVDVSTKNITLENMAPLTTFNFRIKSYNKGGASEASETIEVTTAGTTDIVNEVDKINLNIYPNPCTTHINVDIPSLNSAALQIMDVKGKVIITKDINPGTTSMRVTTNDLPKGIYFIKLSYNGTSVSQKIIKR